MNFSLNMGIIILILCCVLGFLSGKAFSEVLIPDLTDYQVQVLDSDKLLIIDFWADWCKPCKIQRPILERLVLFNDKYNKGRISWLNVNVDKDRKMYKNFRPLRGLPVLLFLKDGKEIYRIIGLTPFITIQDIINGIFREEECKIERKIKRSNVLVEYVLYRQNINKKKGEIKWARY